MPKIIWFLWLQGIKNAPIEVKNCYQSWVKNNADWQTNFLDATSIKDYILLPEQDIAVQAFSDILRINLLATYGGVWVDATCFCVKPLNEWLPSQMTLGFFAFNRPGPDRMISSWFLASEKNNYITITFQKKVNEFWNENKGMRLIESTRWNFLSKQFVKLKPLALISYFFTKMLKVYPYFWFHYTFEYLFLRDSTFSAMWKAVPKISADIPHKLLFSGLFNSLNEELKQEIDEKKSPLYKLTWKYEPSFYKPDTVMEYLINSMN